MTPMLKWERILSDGESHSVLMTAGSAFLQTLPEKCLKVTPSVYKMCHDLDPALRLGG